MTGLKKLLGEKIRFDWRVVTITIVSTLMLIVDHYFYLTARWLPAPWWKYVDRTILYFVIPMAVVLLIFRDRPGKDG